MTQQQVAPHHDVIRGREGGGGYIALKIKFHWTLLYNWSVNTFGRWETKTSWSAVSTFVIILLLYYYMLAFDITHSVTFVCLNSHVRSSKCFANITLHFCTAKHLIFCENLPLESNYFCKMPLKFYNFKERGWLKIIACFVNNWQIFVWFLYRYCICLYCESRFDINCEPSSWLYIVLLKCA